jgi:hypothetical protein
VVAWERVPLPLSIDSRQEVLTGNFVSADYFATLGVSSAIGRLFSPELDEHAAVDPPIVISHSYWQRRFSGAPGIVGTTALVAGRALHIVGVAPRGFRGMDVHYPVDGWMPFSAAETIGRLEHRVFTDRDHGRVERVIGRLRPGATIGRRARTSSASAVSWPRSARRPIGRAFRVCSLRTDRERAPRRRDRERPGLARAAGGLRERGRFAVVAG